MWTPSLQLEQTVFVDSPRGWILFPHHLKHELNDLRKQILCLFSLFSFSPNLDPSLWILYPCLLHSNTQVLTSDFNNPSCEKQVRVLGMLKIKALFSSLSLPDTCFWCRSRTVTRSCSTACCCRTSRSSCRSFTPPPWAWPASSTAWYFQDRGETRLKVDSEKKYIESINFNNVWRKDTDHRLRINIFVSC